MDNTLRNFSPKRYSRIAGFLYLIVIIGGIFAEVFVRQEIVLPKDPAATAANILAHEMLYRIGFAAHIIVAISAIGVLFIFYNLFKQVDYKLVLLMTLFNLISISIESMSILGHYAPLILLKGESHLQALHPEQLHTLAYIPIRLQSTGYDLALVFFGFFCIFTGFLIMKSSYFPRILGVLMVIAGLCYQANSFIHFLVPQHSLFPYIMMPCFIAELSLCVWLLVKGVNQSKWDEFNNRSRLGSA